MRRLLLICCLLLGISSLSLAQDETQSPYEIALERILEAEQSGATELNLKSLGLTELPPEIGNLTNLLTLDLFANQLTSLPSEIGNLTNLQRLLLTKNRLVTLPSEIGNLNKLKTLTLVKNQLINLPPEIGKLVSLRSWVLGENELSTLPPEIGNLSNLCLLSIRFNQVQYLPTEIGQLTKLTDMDDGCNLDVEGNPLISPPPEVIAQGTPAILDYLNNQAWWYLQRLIISGATGFGLLAVLILGIRWRMRRVRRKSKQKRDMI
jgi:internalin A